MRIGNFSFVIMKSSKIGVAIAATRIARESPEYTEAVITGRLRLAFACVSILLIGAATGCSGSPAPAGPGASSPAGGQPASAQSSAAPAWGAATHLDRSQGGEEGGGAVDVGEADGDICAGAAES